MTKSAAVGLVSSQTVWWKSEHNNSWKSSLYNFRTVPRVSTSFKISDLRYCVREARLQKTVCQMGAEKLTDEHKQKRLAAAHQFLQRHQIEGYQCFDHIVTVDETWISYTNIE